MGYEKTGSHGHEPWLWPEQIKDNLPITEKGITMRKATLRREINKDFNVAHIEMLLEYPGCEVKCRCLGWLFKFGIIHLNIISKALILELITKVMHIDGE